VLASEMSGMCDGIVGFLERHREDLDAQSEPVIRARLAGTISTVGVNATGRG
jgi:hypothetical protein